MSADLLSAALACIEGGVSVIPIDKATKRSTLKTWKPFQSSIVDEGQARQWFNPLVEAFAVVGGQVSGGLLILDFDCPRFYSAWLSVVGEQADGLPVQKTGGGGYQVLLRCPNPGSNDKLAWARDEAEETGRTIAIETRGEGGYAVVAPSVHPTGTRYKWLSGDAASIPAVPQARADALLDAARKLDEMPLTRQERGRLEGQALTAHWRRQAGRNGQTSIIEAFNAAHSIEIILSRNGYSRGKHGR